MPAVGHFKNVCDVKLKPRMLRGLIEDHFPEENQPSRIQNELPKIVYFIRTHKLLSEYVTDPTEKKFVDCWKSAVDEWVDGVSRLVSSNMPDKCWIGICLLGVTCQECNHDRFLASYSVWFNKLYSLIQQPSESQFVKVACSSSISDLLTRLEKLPSVKKDGSSLTGKLIQPLLKLLNEDHSEAVLEGVVHILCTILNAFPASVRPYLDNAEAAIASKLLSGKCSDSMMKNLVYCLALLPKAKGDEESWGLLMQKILLLINSSLSDRFQGLEEENKGIEAIRALVRPGKDPPPPLGGPMLVGEAVKDAAKRSEQLTVSTIAMLIFCCSTMLTSPYPVRVNVPIRPLLALIERVLMVDGSVPSSLSPFVTTMQQQSVCVELPVLHLYSLELLAAIIEGMHSQLLPHAAFILRFVKMYFKRCGLPALRRKLYSTTKGLLLFMGAGMALPLAEEVVDNACLDLNPIANENGCTTHNPNSEDASSVSTQSNRRKRKHGSSTGSYKGQQELTGLGMEASKFYPVSPMSLKIAALEALETLLTVAGDLGSASWRPNVDLLLITLATEYCKDGWGNMENCASLADLQLSSLRALLASLLSSACIRPRYLGRSLELFRKGKQQAGKELAGFCAGALLALDVLIHPRFLPLERCPSVNYNSFDEVTRRIPDLHSGSEKQGTPYSSGLQGTGEAAPFSYDDDLYKTWFDDGNPIENSMRSPSENADIMKLSVPGSSDAKFVDENKKETVVETRNNENKAVIEMQQVQDTIMHFQEDTSSKHIIDASVSGDSKPEVTAPEDSIGGKNHDISRTEEFSSDKADELASVAGNDPTRSYADEGKNNVVDLADDDSSMDSFPDIVDVGPDSDTEESD